MLPILVVLAAVLVVAAVWSAARARGAPTSSVDHFHRALAAMSPGDARSSARDGRTPADGARPADPEGGSGDGPGTVRLR